MLVNEGLVLHIVNKLKNENNLSNLTIGLLGMSFKANVDDIRTSLSYKLKKQLKNCCKAVLTTDPYVKTDDSLSSLDLVLKKSDIFVCVFIQTWILAVQTGNGTGLTDF